MSNIPPNEFWFEFASRVEARRPHAPRKMLSLNSKGPLWSWACTMPNCENELHTLSQESFNPPICHGGLPWSFSTKKFR